MKNAETTRPTVTVPSHQVLERAPIIRTSAYQPARSLIRIGDQWFRLRFFGPRHRFASVRCGNLLEGHGIEFEQQLALAETFAFDAPGVQTAVFGPDDAPTIDLGPLPVRQSDYLFRACVEELVLIEVTPCLPGDALWRERVCAGASEC